MNLCSRLVIVAGFLTMFPVMVIWIIPGMLVGIIAAVVVRSDDPIDVAFNAIGWPINLLLLIEDRMKE